MSSRRRFLTSASAIALIAVGSRITLPGVNSAAVTAFTGNSKGGLLGLYEMVFQGGLHRGAILGLGIMPYLSARIFMRLWRVVNPKAEPSRLRTRILTVTLSLIQATGFALALQRMPGAVAEPGLGFIAKTVLTLTAGSLIAMWFGEQLTESEDPSVADAFEEEPILRGQITEGNFAHANEAAPARPQPDGIRR